MHPTIVPTICAFIFFSFAASAGVLADEPALNDKEAAAEEELLDAPQEPGQGQLASESAPSGTMMIPPLFEGRSFDLALEVGGVAWADRSLEHRFFGRVRAGMLWARDPWFASLSLAFDIGGLEQWSLGAVGTLSNYSNGLWGQANINVSLTNGLPILGVTAGWSIVGAELQYAPRREDSGLALILKLRIPIGIILFMMDEDR